MPIYEYEIVNPDGTPKGSFEVMQKMTEPALTRHPVTGESVRRILSPTFVGSGSPDRYAGETCASGACGLPSGGCAGGGCDWD